MALRNARRGLRLAGALGAVVLGSGVMVTNAAALLSSPAQEASTITLSDDDDGVALFSATDMAPGHAVSGCIDVLYDADGSAAFRLHGSSEGSGLSRSLSLIVEAGTGSRFGDCAAFHGAAVYRGTLGEFADRHRDFATGLALAVPDNGTSRSFRITAEVLDDNDAQGTDANATFIWEARPAPSVVIPSTTPASDVSESRPALSGDFRLPGDPVTAGDAPAPLHSQAAPSRARLIPLRSNPSASVIDTLVGGAVYVAERAAFPGVLLLVAGIFVLVQDRIDRRDPKLALAPIYPDPDLGFGEPVN